MRRRAQPTWLTLLPRLPSLADVVRGGDDHALPQSLSCWSRSSLAAAYVYEIKFESTLQAERVAKLRGEIRREHDAIAALRAEWASSKIRPASRSWRSAI